MIFILCFAIYFIFLCKIKKTMAKSSFVLEVYRKTNNGFNLFSNDSYQTMLQGKRNFEKHLEEYFLESETIEKIEEPDDFIWRVKTDNTLIVLRKIYI